MSHITEIDIEIKDLEMLEKSAEKLGLEFVRDQKNYKWYGRFVGDAPMPQGLTEADLGKCDHVLRVKGNPGAYEVGVVKRLDGKPGYRLNFDFWQGGFGLEACIGKDANSLKQRYAAEVAKRQAMREGFKVTEEECADGSIVLTASN